MRPDTELLRLHRLWIADIIATTLNSPSVETGMSKKHLDILVRWYPQITQDGKDCYNSYMNAKKLKSTIKARKELVNCKNLRFSIAAFQALKNSTQPDIFPEHNPPVAAMVGFLKSGKNWTGEKIVRLFSEKKYEVIILTTSECAKIPSNLKKTGTSNDRLEKAFESKTIKNFIASKKLLSSI